MQPQSRHPTDHPLPPLNSIVQRKHALGCLSFDAAQVDAFDALLHEINPDAERVDAARLSQLAAWLLSLPRDEARDVLDERLARIEELRAMIDDPAWNCAESDSLRVRQLLAYLDQPEDLIPDAIPLLGRLDDVLLLELAWPAVSDEAEEYRDFMLYRLARHPAGDGAQQRAAWIQERLTAISMLHQQLRANDGLHLDDKPQALRFRVG